MRRLSKSAVVAASLALGGCGGADAGDEVAETIEAWGAALNARDAPRVCELMEHAADTREECVRDIRNSDEFGWPARLDVRSMQLRGDLATARVRVVDPSRPESSTLRDRTVPFAARRAGGRWRVLLSSR